MVITLGAKKTVNWLSTIARRLLRLRPLPLKALTVLIHVFCLSSRMKERLQLPLNLLSAEHPWMEWKSQPEPLHVDMSFFISFGFSFRLPRPPLHFGSRVITPLTLLSNGYESFWSSIQLNLAFNLPLFIRDFLNNDGQVELAVFSVQAKPQA